MVADMPDSCVVGVDLGGTKLLAGACDGALAVHHRAYRSVLGLDQRGVLDTVVDAVEEVRAAAGAPMLAAGFGIPCTFDHDRGVAVQAVNLPLSELPFAAVMAERLGIPVAADNDANAAVLAEQRLGAARGCRDVAMLTLGTGIGGGLVLGGELYRGARGAGAELGHMVVEADGPRCQGACPNRGCLEAMASGTALARRAVELAAARPDSALAEALRAGREMTGALATELAHDGDEAALEAVRAVGTWLGVGVANLVNMLDPEVVVLGGGVMGAGDLLLEPARAEMLARALPPARDRVRVVAAELGPEAGMLGAALMAWELAGRGSPGPEPGAGFGPGAAGGPS